MIQQFRIDFAMNRGHEMMIDRERGIERNELDELELHILRAQQVPYLLPMDWYEVDGKVAFRYSLSGMKMLVHRLQQEPLSMEQFYGLLLSVTDAILECKEYMLRPEGCLLNEQFLFMGDRLTDIRIAYMPLKHPGTNAVSSADSLLSLAVRWTTYIEEIDGAGLKRIVQLLNHSRSPLSDLRDTLLELIAGGIPAAVNREETCTRTGDSHIETALEYSPPAQQSKEAIPPKSFSSPRLPIDERSKPNGGEEREIDEGEPELPGEQSRRGKWPVIAAAVLAAACVWRFLYAASPTRENLLISASLTLALAAGLLYFKRKSTPFLIDSRGTIAQEDSLSMEPYSEPLSTAKRSWKMAFDPNESVIPHGTTTSMGSYSVSPPQVTQAGKSANTELAQTAVLGSMETIGEEATALLSETKRSAWLSRMWNGQEEKIALDTEIFKIGRSGDGVSYSENAEGISRLHLEIERIDGEHHAKDLGSRNGSLLNGKLMVPYKTYKLEFGDRIHLAGDKGPLYELRAG